MFQEQHNRSFSEISDVHDQYEPTMTSSPGITGQAPRLTYLDTPPMSEATDLPIQGAQYVYPKSHLDQASGLSPYSLGDRDMNPSPHPSYYSVSDLPPTSPLPSPKYKYSSGEITSTPPSRRSSVATTRASIRGQPQAPHDPMPSAHIPSSPNTLQLPGHQRQSLTGSPSSPGFFEMHVRSPTASTHIQGHALDRSASATSYTTAADDYYSAEDDPGNHYGYASSPDYAHDTSSQHHHDIPIDDTHDGRRHDRNSENVSWEGPRAV